MNVICLPSEALAACVRVRSADNEDNSLHPHCSRLKTYLHATPDIPESAVSIFFRNNESAVLSNSIS